MQILRFECPVIRVCPDAVRVSFRRRCFSAARGAPRPLRQAEESRPGPFGSGNFEGDLGQRPIGLALELETLVDSGNRVVSAMPFADQARAGFNLGSGERSD